jgi:hypothetical protein
VTTPCQFLPLLPTGSRAQLIFVLDLRSYSLLRQAAAFHSARPDFCLLVLLLSLESRRRCLQPRRALADDSFLAQELSLSLQASIFFSLLCVDYYLNSFRSYF